MLPTKDYLWLHLKDLPYFRALVRSIEARFFSNIDLVAPTLDLGCGDGHFASQVFERNYLIGVDPWIKPLYEATQRKFYKLTVQSDGEYLPFATGYFSSIVSNSVFEHILNIDDVIIEIGRVTKPAGHLFFSVPNENFLSALSIGRNFDKVKFSNLAKVYRRFFNRISRHYHCDDSSVWKSRLKKGGFDLIESWKYFSPDALACMEWGHYLGLPSLIIRWLTGRWILVQSEWNLAVTKKIVLPYYEAEPHDNDGVYTFYVAYKK